MPECYLLAMTRGSSLDQETNNWSLFSLVEQVQIPTVPSVLPLEVHLYWDFTPAEYAQDYEMRLVLLATPGPRQETRAFPLRSTTPQYRMRLRNIPIKVFGPHRLYAEWRIPDAPRWMPSATFWPLQVDARPPTPSGSETLPSPLAP